MTTPVAGVTHHITLDNAGSVMGFMLDIGSYNSQRADDFAPRIAQGNDTATQQGLWQSWAQTGFTEGVDQDIFTNAQKIYRTDGNVFTNRDMAVMLNAAWNSSDASKVATAPMIVDFGTDLVLVAVGTKVRRFTISTLTWADSTTTFGGNVKWLHVHGAKVYAGIEGAVELYDSSDGDTWAQSVTSPNGQRASCITTWQISTGTVNLVIADANNIKLSSDLGVNFGSAIPIGDASADITNLYADSSVLWIRKSDSLWYYNGTATQKVWGHEKEKYAGNKCFAYHEGFYYLNLLNKIFQVSFSDGVISNFTDVTPYMKGDEEKDLYGHGTPVWMWSGNGHLYCAFDDGESVYPEVLYKAAIGSSWHQAYRGTSGDTMRAGGYSQLGGRTFINDGATRLRRHTTLADTPFPDYPTSGQFITSLHDAGQPFMQKAYREISLEARNLSAAAGRQITVEYSTDKGATYTTVGTMDTDGRTEMQFDTSDGSVAAIGFKLRITLTRGSTATETPVLERFAVGFLLRPNPIYAHSFTIKCGPNQKLFDHVSLETVSVAEQLSFLENAEQSEAPLRLIDMIGRHRLVYISKSTVRQSILEDVASRDTRFVDLVLIDAITGIWIQQILYLEIEITSATFTLNDYVAAVWDTPSWDFFQWE